MDYCEHSKSDSDGIASFRSFWKIITEEQVKRDRARNIGLHYTVNQNWEFHLDM